MFFCNTLPSPGELCGEETQGRGIQILFIKITAQMARPQIPRYKTCFFLCFVQYIFVCFYLAEKTKMIAKVITGEFL